jgi:hypothetical protein
MDLNDLNTQKIVCGWLLILGGVIFLPGGILFSGRAFLKWPAALSRSYLYWERGFVMAAFLVVTQGLVLLDRLLETAGDKILSPSGLTIYLIGTVLVLAAETFGLDRQETIYAPIVLFVVLALLGQAAFGAAILHTGLIPGWVGWATTLWNLAWLILLPIARPRDIYFPVLHHVAPLVIGISLLGGR